MPVNLSEYTSRADKLLTMQIAEAVKPGNAGVGGVSEYAG